MTPEQSMLIYLAECEIHAEVLNQGLVDIQKHLPLSARAEIDKDTLRILDQIAYRFAKLQDSMGEKVLPLILVLAQEPIAANSTFVEKLNRLERIGAIPSTEEWKNFALPAMRLRTNTRMTQNCESVRSTDLWKEHHR